MKYCTLLFLGMLSSFAPAATKFLINEVHVNPPGTVNVTDGDGNYEYIEIISVDSVTGMPIANQACDGLTVLVIDSSGTAGEVQEAWNLNGLITGTNGILMIGDGYAPSGDDYGGPWHSYLQGTGTASADPPSMGGDNIGPNPAYKESFTLMLVKGFVGIADPGPSGNGTDIDSDDDANRIIGPYIHNPQLSSVPTPFPPWISIEDSVGVNEATNTGFRATYATASLPYSGITDQWGLSNFSRKRIAGGASNIALNATAWYGGEILGSLLSVAYNPTNSAHYFGLVNAGGFAAPGEATPGQPNLIIAPPEAVVRLNEVSIDPPVSNSNYEYVELISTNRNNASLAGYTLLVIDSSTIAGYGTLSAVGEVMEAWKLDGLNTGLNSLCLLGNNYSSSFTPFSTYVANETVIGSPNGMGNGNISDNDAFTLLLVKNFTGTARNGATAGTDLDANDDGVLDAGASFTIVDSIGFDQVIGGVYSTGAGKTYATTKIATSGLWAPDSLCRIPGTTALTPASWFGGKYGARHPLAVAYATGPFFGNYLGAASPGQPNYSATPATATNIRLNEVHLGANGTGGAVGYAEITALEQKITLTTNLYLLVVDNTPGSVGIIRSVVDLRGMNTGTNGVAFFGDGAEEPLSPWANSVSPITVRDDPESHDINGVENPTLNIGPSTFAPTSGKTVLLVANFTGNVNDDLDAGDDGTFEITPWSQLLDSISFGPATTTAASIGAPGFSVSNLSRTVANFTANNAESWYYGTVLGNISDPLQIVYTDSFVGPFKAAASPGRLNHTAPFSESSLLINEIHMNPLGGDNNKEYVEIIATSGISQSTNGYTLLMVDGSTGKNNTGNVGNILEAWSLDGLSTGSQGLLMLGDGYPGLSPYVGATAPVGFTKFGDPLGLDPADLAREDDNGAVSFLLVKDFNGVVASDLDTAGDYPGSTGAQGDGVIDAIPTPWSGLVDSVGIKFWNSDPDGDSATLDATLQGVVYGFADKSQTGFTPDNVSRIRGNIAGNNAAAWYGGDLASAGNGLDFDNVQKFPSGFSGKATPGRNNVANAGFDLLDSDGDTVKNVIEDATGMNIMVGDIQKLPQTGSLDVSGTIYPTFTYNQLLGTSGYSYEVQTSTDLITWTTGNTVQVSTAANADGATQSFTVRPTDAYFTGLPAANRRVFLRLKTSH